MLYHYEVKPETLKCFIPSIRISEPSEISIFFPQSVYFVLMVIENVFSALSSPNTSQLFILLFNSLKELFLAWAHTSCVSQQAMIDFLCLFFFFIGLGMRFSNCSWDHPAELSQCSSHLLFEFAHDDSASCWARSHSVCILARSERPYLWGVRFFCVRIDFESSHRPGHGAGHVYWCALWVSLYWRRKQAVEWTPLFIDCIVTTAKKKKLNKTMTQI